MFVYPGTDHAFFNDTRPEVHDAEASAQAWERATTFLRTQLA
jgi:carboxymethylenebutenolidase